MSKSDVEIAAEVYGDEWAEAGDAVRHDWGVFVNLVRGGDLKLRGDARYAEVNRALGRDGDEPSTDVEPSDEVELVVPVGEDAIPEYAKPAPAKKSVPEKKSSLKAAISKKLKGK